MDKSFQQGFSSFWNKLSSSQSSHYLTQSDDQVYYRCPMLCEGGKKYKQKGNCQVCGMELTFFGSSPSSHQLDREWYFFDKVWLVLFFAAISMIVSMSDSFFVGRFWDYVELTITSVVVYLTRSIFYRSIQSFKSHQLNMYSLIGIGSGIAFLYSLVVFFLSGFFPEDITVVGQVDLYFESTAVILAFTLLGETIEKQGYKKTSHAISELMSLAPKNARVILDGKEVVIDKKKVSDSHVVLVRTGDVIPLDGTVTEGESSVDESLVTGESGYVKRIVGDHVYAGSIVREGLLYIQPKGDCVKTMIEQIADLVLAASQTKPPIQRLSDKVVRVFTPVVFLIALITFFLWTFLPVEHGIWLGLVNAISVLIIACPCALGLAVPLSITAGIGRASKIGILIKDAKAFEAMNRLTKVVLDKTGTLTEGKLTLKQIHTFSSISKNHALSYGISIAKASSHPLSEALVNEGRKQGVKERNVTLFKSYVGKGLKGTIQGEIYHLGSRSFVEMFSKARINYHSNQKKEDLFTELFLAKEGEIIAVFIFSDMIKKTSYEAVKFLKQGGLDLVLLSGDLERVVKQVGDSLGLSVLYAEHTPEKKMKVVKMLQDKGNVVAMVGDGINDAPALSQADIGIAIGTGADVAMKTADITVVNGDLKKILLAKQISCRVIRNIKQNLALAFGYNVLSIPIAMGALFPFTGILLSPMIAAMAMTLSSISVTFNATRLLYGNVKSVI